MAKSSFEMIRNHSRFQNPHTLGSQSLKSMGQFLWSWGSKCKHQGWNRRQNHSLFLVIQECSKPKKEITGHWSLVLKIFKLDYSAGQFVQKRSGQ